MATRNIPQHHRPDGEWCRWSGVITVRTDGLCPDRCQAPKEDSAGTDHDAECCDECGEEPCVCVCAGCGDAWDECGCD